MLRKCELCNKPATKLIGSGRFCSKSCSRRVGGSARWKKHSPNVIRKPQDPYAKADLGLVGEYVTVNDGKTKLTGWINTYDPETDMHTVKQENGKYRSFDLRACVVKFLDSP